MNGSGMMMRYNLPMDGMYQLVFSGELVKGQHRGVVKRRLRESLNLSKAQVEKLFSGKPVVVKRDVDEATAEKYQEIFKKAGGLLQIAAMEEAAESAQSASEPEALAAEPDDAPDETATESADASAAELEDTATQAPVEPPTSSADNPSVETVETVETPSPTTESAPPATEPDDTQAPDVAVADVDASLADESEEVPTVPDADFEVAEVGADMLLEPAVVVAPKINDVDFDVAEVGADIGDRDDQPPPPAPDVSHIKLVD